MISFDFQAFDFNIRVESSQEQHILKTKRLIETVFGKHLSENTLENTETTFSIEESGADISLYQDGELLVNNRFEDRFYDYVESRIRLAVAENAPNHVFIHAGAVRKRNQTLIFPASSYSGKSTVVLEMVRQGAKYLSDEYAVLDSEARVVPFAKPISMRTPGRHEQRDVSIEEIGGVAESNASDPNIVLITKYDADAEWKPVELSKGEGVLKLLEHAVPAKKFPNKTLTTLSKLASKVRFYSSERPDAVTAAKLIDALI